MASAGLNVDALKLVDDNGGVAERMPERFGAQAQSQFESNLEKVLPDMTMSKR